MPCVTPVQISVAGNGLAARGDNKGRMSPWPRNDSNFRQRSKFGAAAEKRLALKKAPGGEKKPRKDFAVFPGFVVLPLKAIVGL
jgi:hypothetical protein